MKRPLSHPAAEAVKAIHAEVLAGHGGGAGLREAALLESAVAAPQATMAGEPLFTDPLEIAAAYLFYLCRNHPFVDGNKRTALATCLVFLSGNDLLPDEKLDVEAWEALTLDVAASRLDREQTAARLRKLLRSRKRATPRRHPFKGFGINATFSHHQAMKVFIVHAHAEPGSFNGAMSRTAQDTLRAAGDAVTISDLYAMKFDPVSDRRNFITVKNPDYFKQQIEEMHATEAGGFAPDVEAELRKMEACDLMIWQFPLWWFGLPGILKGWADRVFAMGRTYGGERFYENGVFKGKRALLSITTGGPEAVYQKGGWNGDIHAILRPIQRGILRFTGWDVLAPNIVYAPVRVTDEERQASLRAWATRLRAIESEQPIDVGDY